MNQQLRHLKVTYVPARQRDVWIPTWGVSWSPDAV